ncbi:Pentatricopeptide repeat-containing protein [Platanthera zijinensis]|uniref:Pentatricopeptide repeat-containing protein n=1 Tax=Platanthera zijinensis TaxID=2320716 RepID=A0AAP0BFN3_9ASPA
MAPPSLFNLLPFCLPVRLASSNTSQSAAIPFVKINFSRLFQQCSQLQNTAAVRRAHARMITIGFIPTIFVANCLIHAYIRCMVLDNARKVFDELSHRDIISWNAVISGYTQNGLMREAQTLFNAMPDRDAVSWNSMMSGYLGNGNLNDSAVVFSAMMKIGTERPDRTTIAVILKLISALEECGSGIQVHVIAVKAGLDSDVVAGSALVDMYAKCRSLGDALRFFGEMPQKNSVTWSAVIGGCARNDRFRDALRMFVNMQREGIETSQSSYASIFRSCAGLPCLEAGKQLHGHALKSNFISDVVVGTAALDMYAKCHSLRDAVEIFRRLPNRSLQTFNAMLVGFLRNDRGIEALNLFMFMNNISHIIADEISFSAALSACAEHKAHSQGMQIHCLALKSPHGLNVCVMNAVLDMYGKCGDVISSRRVFEGLDDKDEVSWNALITALEQNGLYKETLAQFNQMVSWGLDPDDFTYGSVLKACTALQSPGFGMAIHDKIIKSGLGSDSFVGSGLIDLYCKCGMLEDAEAIHRRIESVTTVSWNSIISGFSLQNESEEAQKLFSQMLGMGLQPDNFTYATILDTCANLAVIGLGRQLHAQILKQELHEDVFISSTLVDMYAKCGNMQDSLLIFEKMSKRDFVSWNAVICGFANHGLVLESLSMFESMKAENVTPSHATFVAVLRACGHAGLVDEGRRYFESMHGCYNLEPHLEHYSCMVDLIGRCEGVHEALGVINGIPYEADAVIWRALLSACQIQGNAEVAELALKEILVLEPDDSSACILLSNIYAKAGRWDEVSRMRKMMRSGGLKKEPGCSWIEVENKMHAFIAGDHAHPSSDHMFNILDSLVGEMILTTYEIDELVST